MKDTTTPASVTSTDYLSELFQIIQDQVDRAIRSELTQPLSDNEVRVAVRSCATLQVRAAYFIGDLHRLGKSSQVEQIISDIAVVIRAAMRIAAMVDLSDATIDRLRQQGEEKSTHKARDAKQEKKDAQLVVAAPFLRSAKRNNKGNFINGSILAKKVVDELKMRALWNDDTISVKTLKRWDNEIQNGQTAVCPSD